MIFSWASSCVSVLNELWPYKCIRVTAIQSETNFSVSKLFKYEPSILMRILRSRVSWPNLFRIIDFSLFMQEKPRWQIIMQLATNPVDPSRADGGARPSYSPLMCQKIDKINYHSPSFTQVRKPKICI